MNIIRPLPTSTSPEVVISLDAEKAFDRVELLYLLTALKKIGFGGRFSSWIRLLYTDPQASVCTGDTRSDYLPLSRGTRQGCPLSPLIFALAIEPLSIALRSSPLLQGIYSEGTEHRVIICG